MYDPYDQHKDHPYRFRRANGTVMMHYDALSTFLQANKMAIQQGKQNPTPDDIKSALLQINGAQSFQGITGVIPFGSGGDPIDRLHFVLYVVKSKDGGGYTHLAAYQGCFREYRCASILRGSTCAVK